MQADTTLLDAARRAGVEAAADLPAVQWEWMGGAGRPWRVYQRGPVLCRLLRPVAGREIRSERGGVEVIYGSVCSGIEAASVAWEGLGWRAAWFAEIDPFASAVLAHRFPEVANLGDFTQIQTGAGAVDVLVGGTPCQSFSVAGRRLGGSGGILLQSRNLGFVTVHRGTVPFFAAWNTTLWTRTFSPRKWDCPPRGGQSRQSYRADIWQFPPCSSNRPVCLLPPSVSLLLFG